MKVFLDANVYFAGFYSPTGASSVLLELIRLKKLEAFSSRLVLTEAERNLRLKAKPPILKTFHQFLKEIPLKICPPPAPGELAKYESFIHPKDVPVLAAAVAASVDFFITLDRRHFMTSEVLKKITTPKIITPGEYLTDHCCLTRRDSRTGRA